MPPPKLSRSPKPSAKYARGSANYAGPYVAEFAEGFGNVCSCLRQTLLDSVAYFANPSRFFLRRFSEQGGNKKVLTIEVRACRRRLFWACNESGSHPSDCANRTPRDEESKDGKECNQEIRPCGRGLCWIKIKVRFRLD